MEMAKCGDCAGSCVLAVMDGINTTSIRATVVNLANPIYRVMLQAAALAQPSPKRQKKTFTVW
jgi:hypothetical protein